MFTKNSSCSILICVALIKKVLRCTKSWCAFLERRATGIFPAGDTQDFENERFIMMLPGCK